MTQYIVAHTGFGLAASGTAEDCFIDISSPSGVSIMLKKIRWAQAFSIADVAFRMRVYRASSAMTGGTTTTFTPVTVRDDAPNSVTTVTIKNAQGTSTKGTTSDVLMDVTWHHRATFEWVARDWRDMLESDINGRIQITLTPSAANTANNYFQVEWIE
jgi:hypothetical protein